MAHARHSDSRCSLRANLSWALVASDRAVCASPDLKAASLQRSIATEYKPELPEFDETSIASSHNFFASCFPPDALFTNARTYLLSVSTSDLADAVLTASFAAAVASAMLP